MLVFLLLLSCMVRRCRDQSFTGPSMACKRSASTELTFTSETLAASQERRECLRDAQHVSDVDVEYRLCSFDVDI